MIDVPKSLHMDFTKPTHDMFLRDGEQPSAAIIAVSPTHTDLVTDVLRQLSEALMVHMAPEAMTLILEDEITFNNGRKLALVNNSVLFSLTYPTAPGRTFEMELGPPADTTVH